MKVDGAWISAHIPHQGRMCLLDEVLSWDGEQLLARADNHRAADHPLRAHGRLGSVCAIEYAAQAAAVHAALLCQADEAALPVPSGAGMGLLASARAVELSAARLDDVETELRIRIRRLHGDRHGALYAFAVSAGSGPAAADSGTPLASGRLSLRLGVDLSATATPDSLSGAP